MDISPAEQCLTDYWGKDWPRVKAAMDAEGFRYDRLGAVTVPWETAAIEIEKQLTFTPDDLAAYKESFMRWDGIADQEWLVNQFGGHPKMDSDSLAHVQGLAEAHAPELEMLADELIRGLESEVKTAFAQGRFIRSLYTTKGAIGLDQNKQVFYTKGAGFEGWTVGLGLAWEDVPHLQAIDQELKQQVKARDKEIRAYLGNLRKAQWAK